MHCVLLVIVSGRKLEAETALGLGLVKTATDPRRRFSVSTGTHVSNRTGTIGLVSLVRRCWIRFAAVRRDPTTRFSGHLLFDFRARDRVEALVRLLTPLVRRAY